MTEYTPITEMGPLDRFTYRGTNWVPIDYDNKEYRFQRETVFLDICRAPAGALQISSGRRTTVSKHAFLMLKSARR